MWPRVFRDRIAAFREVQQRELENVQHTFQAIKETPPEFREEPRQAYDESLAKLQESQRQESLWWLRRPKMPGLSLSEVQEVIDSILNQKGYWNIGVTNTKNRKVMVTFEDGEGEHTQAGIPFSKAEKWAEGLPDAADIAPERMEALAAAMGKKIVEVDGERFTVDVETGEIEEPAKEEQEPEPVRAKVIPNGGRLIAENYGQGRVEVGPEDMEQWLREQKKEEPVAEEIVKEEPEVTVEEKPVEEVITYAVNDKVAQLRAAEKSNDILLIQYLSRGGEVSARFIRVLFVSKDGKRFGVQDDQSRELRTGWYTASVLAIYPPVPQKTMRGYADLLSGYKKGSDKVCMLPYDGDTVVFKLPVWTEPDNVASLEASGLWIRK